MTSLESCPPPSPDLLLELERHIQNRTSRRVRGLRVELVAEHILLSGRANTYYLKQIAQHCVWDILPQARLDNAIVVDADRI